MFDNNFMKMMIIQEIRLQKARFYRHGRVLNGKIHLMALIVLASDVWLSNNHRSGLNLGELRRFSRIVNIIALFCQ